jgi:glycosyltransferase involved in cell wall biosynthesis
MPPRLSIGLPVYNGQNYLAQSLDSLLGQSFGDFELIISDNASTDGTAEISRRYERMDSRIRFYRQPQNIGLAPNHNFVVEKARGEYFKWASHDDLYGRDLLKLCVEALDEHPQVVLAHSWTAMIDGAGRITETIDYPLSTASERAPERFRSLLFDDGGDDDGGMMRIDVLRRTAMKDSYHHSDRTTITELGLHGPFYQVPDWLYFRRDHPERAERACPTTRSRCANMDPRRADRLRHPLVRLYGEYIWAYFAAVRRAPLSSSDRQECYRYLAQWFASRALPRRDEDPAARTPGHPATTPSPAGNGPASTALVGSLALIQESRAS